MSFMSLCWLPELGKDKKCHRRIWSGSHDFRIGQGFDRSKQTQNKLRWVVERGQTFYTQTPGGKKAEMEIKEWNDHFKVIFRIAVKAETVASCWMNWPCLESCFHVFFPDFLEGEINSLVTGRWDKISAHSAPLVFGLFSSVQEFSPHQSPPANFVYRAPSRKANAFIWPEHWSWERSLRSQQMFS